MPDRLERKLQDIPPASPAENDSLVVVGIGASAGGLSALDELFDCLPIDSGAAFVVIQHLSPDFKSLMKELLERHTEMQVYRVREGMELQPNSVYLIPPGKNLVVESNFLRLEERKKNENRYELNFPIDLFFQSLANSFKERAIGVILSGSGSDGSQGLREIKEAGGVALVQAPETAEFDGMPKSAIATVVIDRVLPVRELAQLIYQCIVSPLKLSEIAPDSSGVLNTFTLKEIAGILIDTENLDFSHYKPSTMSRRIHRRCLISDSDSIERYIELLKTTPEEREVLCADLLIKVTRFFRDREAWEHLENNVLPLIIERAKPHDELRFWVTACSTGEEAYSLAILIHEALIDINKPLTIKIFATDIDRAALETASLGIYPQSIANNITPERLQRYFIPKDNCYQVTRTLREMMIFSTHDLTKDAGFTRMNLISCRNVLIYMQSDLQNKVIRNLHFSLVNQGTLFLGEAETLGNFEAEFKPIHKKWKLYRKRRDIRLPLPVRGKSQITPHSLVVNKPETGKHIKESIKEQTLKRILQASGAIALAVDRHNRLLYVSGDARHIFKTPDGEITNEITKMVVQPLQLPLNTALHRAKKEKKAVAYRGIKLDTAQQVQQVGLQVIPPSADFQQDELFIVKIEPEKTIDSQSLLVEEFESSSAAQKRILELERELQHTRENLQALVEELESTNEEQQASNEELTASNEELQSTNEELHSVNEELHTVNIEYQSKIQELTELNNDIDNLLKSTEIGVIFLDADLRIRKFTPAATAAISLRYSDLERPLEELSLKIECPQLVDLLHEVLETQQSQELEVKLKHTESYFLMQIHIYQTEKQENEGLVISFVKLDRIKQVQLELENALVELKNREQEINQFFELSLEMLCIADINGYFRQINPSFERILGYTTAEILSQPFINLVHPDDVEATLNEVKKLAAGHHTIGFENRYRCQDGSYRWFRWMASASDNGLIYATAHDLTEQKRSQKLQNRQLAAIETASDGIAILHDGRFIYFNQAHLDIFGFSQPEELIGQSWHILYEAEEVKRIEQEVFPILLERGKWQGTTKAKHRDGHLFDEEVTLTYTPQGDLICVCRDVTELLQARQKLLRANVELERRVAQRTQTLADFSDRQKQIHRLAIANHQDLDDLFADYLQVGCQMFNLATGIVSEVKDDIYKIVAVESPLGLEVGAEFSCADTYCAEVIQSLSTLTFGRVGEIESMKNHPVYVNLKLESFISTPIFVNGTLYGTLNFSDTTPREKKFSQEEIEIIELMAKDIGNSITSVRAEEALKKSEIRFRNTFEQAAVGVAHVSPAGKFIKVNQRLCDIVDYENDILVNLTFQEITHPDDLNADLEYVRQMLAGEISNYSMEKRYIKSDDSIVWIDLTVSLVKDSWGQPDYFISVIEDISGRKQTELALEESRIKLKQANRAKDEFIAHMSHELRTPLTSILGFSKLLQQDSQLPSQRLRYANIVHQSGEHLLALINDILDFSKITAQQLKLEAEDFNLIPFLTQIVTALRIRAQEKGLTLSANFSPALPTAVNGDLNRLRQVLYNLLSNAIKFTETGSVTLRVTYITEITDRDKRGTKGRGNKIRFEVEDTGIGISDDQFDAIFAPFEQLNVHGESHKGTGLGLTISQNIVRLMGSQIQLASQVGRGSKFWFDLELPEVEASALPNSSEFNWQQPRRLKVPQKILIVDDNDDNRILLVSSLQPLGFMVAEASDGAMGLTVAETFMPDVILTDIVMPVMDGKEMIARIKHHPQLKNIPIFMLSANSQLILQPAEVDCDGFLPKPFNLEQLLELLTNHLQLDWQLDEATTEKDNLSTLDVPSQEQLIYLLDLVSLGDMQAVEAEIDSLVALEAQYTAFAREIKQLVASFQQNQLESFIQTFITI